MFTSALVALAIFSHVGSHTLSINHHKHKIKPKIHHIHRVSHHRALSKHTHKKRSRFHLGAHYTVSSTCYDASQGSTTASGRTVFLGEVANNFLPLGTHIVLDTPAFGKRHFIVLDRIGWGSALDIFNPSEVACDQWGRREIGFYVLEPNY